MEAITRGYMAWDLAMAAKGLGALFELPEDAMVQSTIRMVVVDLFSVSSPGVCSSKDPNVVITTRTLEVFRAAHLRSPRLTIQSFTRTLCNLHGVACRPYLGTQFSVAFDIYLDVLARVKQHVMATLGHDTPNWRLENACPACLYKLEGEAELELPFLSTMDGNNSLKRFEKLERSTHGPGPSKEREDGRQVPGDYHLSREEVDRWGKDRLEELMKGFVPDEEYEEEKDGCSDRWQNMKEAVTGKAWAMYEEMGIFLSLCRHGFVLLVADMRKVWYAVVNYLINVLGEVASGYDIGCKFKDMVNKHPVLGPHARAHKFRSLVGAFHGHGHCRLCQLSNLATYVKGVGLEDLEYCETFFSKSNALAASTRHATRFHRQQTIVNYLEHSDTFEAYTSLSALIVRKYKRALEVKATEPALEETMRQLNIESKDDFVGWLAAEMAALKNLMWEPIQETLQMEYYQKLVTLADVETRRIETQRHHALELHLEIRLDTARWVPGSERYKVARVMVVKRRYQRALDKLQALVISRMFELTKMNMSGTGYKLRKHIAKALQARSRAVKTALKNYNDVAPMMDADPLTWEEFDILRDGRYDIWMYPWAKPSGRIERANDEIPRLNIEIRRDVFLRRTEASVREERGEALAHQVFKYRMLWGRFSNEHVPGFTGSLLPGVAVNKDRLGSDPTPTDTPMATAPAPPAGIDEVEVGEDEEQDEEQGEQDLVDQFTIAQDSEVDSGE
ncbi:hypothetical protein C8F04DRAFT_1317247 [Mycena alexandri]|uniref:CxC1-like cysteine cluster associated with KDZ transposases domain-containing protein n=1 Tax=Mycena alexandri TaxID=1745969 RepID=A0AAD6S649_9AGAR|nr:hypothetical protein C8F04DRAFT_1317247 [Mycena alexandri]